MTKKSVKSLEGKNYEEKTFNIRSYTVWSSVSSVFEKRRSGNKNQAGNYEDREEKETARRFKRS